MWSKWLAQLLADILNIISPVGPSGKLGNQVSQFGRIIRSKFHLADSEIFHELAFRRFQNIHVLLNRRVFEDRTHGSSPFFHNTSQLLFELINIKGGFAIILAGIKIVVWPVRLTLWLW